MSQPAYRLFNVELKRREQLSPALTRFVFGGPEVAEMKTLAADQRIKIFFPDASGQPPSLPGGSEWYQAYRSVEPARRPPMRTYTIRALRAEQEEVDVEFVLHGENGPASAWATHARIGDRLQLAAPNRQYGDDPGGYEWKPPAGVRHILLIADETALPAVAGILEELAGETEPPVVEAFLEVPGEADILDLPAIPAARLHWLPRHQAGIHSRNGERMIEAARQARLPEREVAGGAAQELEDI
ncbi:TPA: siderophore-interacting protein, partial [Pseudomonas aeruginosa]